MPLGVAHMEQLSQRDVIMMCLERFAKELVVTKFTLVFANVIW